MRIHKMPTMKKVGYVMASVFLIGASLMLFVFVSIHGFFDQGLFEVVKAEWSTPTQVASIAKRSDHEALSGDQYFVIVGDRLLTSTELRHAYYSDGLIFRAGSDCLTLHWENLHHLIVACYNRSIKPNEIAVQHHQSGSVAISYDGIPNKK